MDKPKTKKLNGVYAKIADLNQTPSFKAFLMVGMKGTGKTTNILRFIEIRRLVNKQNQILPPKTLIFTYSDDPVFDQFTKVKYNQLKSFTKGVAVLDVDFLPPELQGEESDKKVFTFFLRQIRENFRKGILILDDCNAIFSAGINMTARRLLTNMRHQQIDAVMAFHTLNEVPNFMIPHLNYLWLFKTADEPSPEKLSRFNAGFRASVLETFNRIEREKNQYVFAFLKIS